MFMRKYTMQGNCLYGAIESGIAKLQETVADMG